MLQREIGAVEGWSLGKRELAFQQQWCLVSVELQPDTEGVEKGKSAGIARPAGSEPFCRLHAGFPLSLNI